MSTTILTDEQIVGVWGSTAEPCVVRQGNEYLIHKFARAIEQAVLQSEQVQAWKKDAELWRAMQEHSVVTFMNDYGRKLAIATVEIGRFPEKLALEQFVRAAMEKQS